MSIQSVYKTAPFLYSFLPGGDGVTTPLTPLHGLAAYYQASPAAPVDGQLYALNVDSSGKLMVTSSGGTSTVKGIFLSSAPTLANNDEHELLLDSAGNLLTKINTALPAGTNLLGKFGIDQTTNGTTNRVNIGNDGQVAATQSGTWLMPIISGSTRITGGTLTRPADTTAYASGDLVANSTTAGSVTPISITVARANDKAFTILKGQLQKSTTSTTNAQFRMHFWNVSPTVTNGDNGALLATKSGYIGSIDIDMSLNAVFSDGALGNGAPNTGSAMISSPASGTQVIYCLIEARNAYTPGNAETFVPYLEVIQE